MGVFDIIGPVMIGPSSSHTAGAARLGRLARYLLGESPIKAEITFYGSFAQTYRGHGTDRACVAGLLGWTPDDPRLRDALTMAPELGLQVMIAASAAETEHPNTVRFRLTGGSGKVRELMGVSTGGGRIRMREFDGYSVDLDGSSHTLLTRHNDRPGIVAFVSQILALQDINISAMRLFRQERKRLAMMFIETDTPVANATLAEIAAHPAIEVVRTFPPV